MNNENKYQFINNLPKEYHRVFWDIMISAESDKELDIIFHKSECKLIMRYLYKKDKEIDRLNNIINELEKYLKERGQHFLIDNCQKEIIYEFRRTSNEYTKALDKLKELKEGK